VQAESHDAATKIFGKDHPHLQMPGAWIEIMEIMPLPTCSDQATSCTAAAQKLLSKGLSSA
jgi:hypothetical protein